MLARSPDGFLESDFADEGLPDVPDVPGMISFPTQAYYAWLTRSFAAGQGAVVEVGTFLGRSTVHLAAGMAAAGRKDPLYCYDGFRWQPHYASTLDLGLADGESFQPHFEANVRPVHPHLVVTACDLLDLHWQRGPIELLVLDAPKQLPEISATLATFSPVLRPGSLVVMEDFLYFPAYTLAWVIGRLGDRVSLQHVVRESHTVGVRIEAPLEAERAQGVDFQPLRATPAEAEAGWDALLDPLPDDARTRLGPGRILHLYDLGEEDLARARLRERAIGDAEQLEWERLAGTHLQHRYPGLFAELGLRRALDPRRADDRARIWRQLRRTIRAPYLAARRGARRALDALGASR